MLQVRIAVSLHTPDDELRDTLVPVNNRWSIDEVLSAARYYADASGRRVSIEYALIGTSTINRGERWHEFHGGPRALSDAELEKLLAPWLDR